VRNMLKTDHSQVYNNMINLVRRNRVSPKNAEKRVRLNVSVQPTMAALVEAVLVDFIFYMDELDKLTEPDGENT
jgi:hypothetical protein